MLDSRLLIILALVILFALLWTSTSAENYANYYTYGHYNPTWWNRRYSPYRSWRVSEYIPEYWWWNRWMPYPQSYWN